MRRAPRLPTRIAALQLDTESQVARRRTVSAYVQRFVAEIAQHRQHAVDAWVSARQRLDIFARSVARCPPGGRAWSLPARRATPPPLSRWAVAHPGVPRRCKPSCLSRARISLSASLSSSTVTGWLAAERSHSKGSLRALPPSRSAEKLPTRSTVCPVWGCGAISAVAIRLVMGMPILSEAMRSCTVSVVRHAR